MVLAVLSWKAENLPMKWDAGRQARPPIARARPSVAQTGVGGVLAGRSPTAAYPAQQPVADLESFQELCAWLFNVKGHGF
jgi:hypothetical protein